MEERPKLKRRKGSKIITLGPKVVPLNLQRLKEYGLYLGVTHKGKDPMEFQGEMLDKLGRLKKSGNYDVETMNWYNRFASYQKFNHKLLKSGRRRWKPKNSRRVVRLESYRTAQTG
jgi:hypothetical protein